MIAMMTTSIHIAELNIEYSKELGWKLKAVPIKLIVGFRRFIN